MLFRFSDGDQFNIGGPLRTEHRHGGFAWSAQGALCQRTTKLKLRKIIVEMGVYLSGVAQRRL